MATSTPLQQTQRQSQPIHIQTHPAHDHDVEKGQSVANEHAAETEASPPKAYTVFTRPERWIITLIMGVAMFFSPMTANIYFPAVPSLAQAMAVSVQKINLTITAYIVVQGLSPLFVGDLADKAGRRPIYMLTFAVYIGASLGLALNHPRDSYVVLTTLRMLQSAGCSATAAISYGVLADVAPPAKRGHMLGAAMVAANTGPTIGPLLGGIISDRAGWCWIFWFLTLLGAAFLVVLCVLFPETSRRIVDNGRFKAPPWNRPILSLVRKYPSGASHESMSPRGTKDKFQIPNPLPALSIVLSRDASLVLWISAVHYMAYYCVQATMPGLFTSQYDLNELQLGLTYLAIGTGVALGGFANGRFLDINYRLTANEVGFTIDKVSGDDIRTFPIEKARTRYAYVLVLVHAVMLSGYGWACRAKTHISLPITLQFSLGFLQTCIVQTFNTLLVDIFPDCPSTASASGNITRCALSAAGIAAVQPLIEHLGYGWVFTIVAGFAGAPSIAAVRMIRSYGMIWRNRRR